MKKHKFFYKDILNSLILFFLLSSCYSAKQGYYQSKYLLSRQSIDKVIAYREESPERIKKLQLSKDILLFAKEELALEPGDSYETYVQTETPVLTWIVQAAYKNELKLKTWWFPLIGEQPYLGFFQKNDALIEKEQLKKDNFDIKVSPVYAFSLLGYISDPIYSSMLDNYDELTFLETLIHETVHRTIYVKNEYDFNENLADFVARKGAISYLTKKKNILPLSTIDSYISKIELENHVSGEFQKFLQQAKTDLIQFYETHKALSLSELEPLREKFFLSLSHRYQASTSADLKKTYFKNFFPQGHINNAVILSYSVYTSHQNEFEEIYIKLDRDIKKLIFFLKKCLKEETDNVWQRMRDCYGKDASRSSIQISKENRSPS